MGIAGLLQAISCNSGMGDSEIRSGLVVGNEGCTSDMVVQCQTAEKVLASHRLASVFLLQLCLSGGFLAMTKLG